ncbi:MAG TPA: SulP family inorganic anion transporter [Acidimicrobiales bacterium]|nr:SulP family inorganic anion transporter [Acidimicrobiales bacterium]
MARFVPAVSWLRAYRREWLRADLVGGLTAGLVVVPQAMAYATIADLPVQVGLYTCMVPMAVYALLGGSRVLSVSTTSTIATLTASTLVTAGVAASAGADDAPAALATLVLLVGLVLLAARLFRLGPIVDNVSDAIVTGLKIGVGLTVAVGQLPKALGIEITPDGESFFDQIGPVLRHLGDADTATVLLSVGTVAVLLGLGRVLPTVPAALVAVAGGIALVALFDIDEHGVALVAEVPRGLPTPALPSFDHIDALLPGAIAIALMAYLETVSVARAVRRSGDPPVDNDQELVANGTAAVAGAFFGALPPAGGFSQTAVNQRAGARTQVSALVTVGVAVAAALFLGPVLSDLPQATLAALVIVAVLGLISPAELVFLARFDRLELFVALLTAAVGLSAGLLVAVAVGVIANLLLVLHELNHVDVDELRPLADGSLVPASPAVPADGADPANPAGPATAAATAPSASGPAHPEGVVAAAAAASEAAANVAKAVASSSVLAASAAAWSDPMPGLLVLRVGAPLYTANVRGVATRILEHVAAADPGPEVVVVDATVVGRLSVTCLSVFRELDRQLADQGVELWFASLPPRALAQAHLAPGWASWDRAGRLHPTATAAVAAYRARVGHWDRDHERERERRSGGERRAGDDRWTGDERRTGGDRRAGE